MTGPAVKLLTLFACLLALAACSITRHDADSMATKFGFDRRLVTGEPFSHVVFESALADPTIPTLHVYIEGDGTPWKAGRYPATDPTPRRALAMELLALDPEPAIYVGRPCYFGLEKSAHCNQDMWTSRRYAPEVIASMAAVIRSYQQKYRVQRLILVGYSGGGTIAVLLAAELDSVEYLVTLAANLDIDLWTGQRGFLPLTGSVNPVDQVELTADIPQLHLMGGADTTVPNSVTTSYTSKLPPNSSRLYPDFDHACCWVELWASLLAEKPWEKAREAVPSGN
jgi:dienelactone hydrolase